MMMKKALISALTCGVALGSGSFMDMNFGPLKFGNDEKMKIVEQSEREGELSFFDESGGFVKFPPKDYVDDLGEGPLFAGIVSFAHLPVVDCVGYKGKEAAQSQEFDIAIVGAPFDTAVSYRNGARFGPAGIRDGSRRMMPGSYTALNPDFDPLSERRIVDCGDIAMTPFDNRIALDQLYRGHRAVLNHTTHSKNYKEPRIVTLGGDHTTTFAALRALSEVHGPISVLHFDSHIDTWHPQALSGNVSSYAQLNHGTFLHYAADQGYLQRNNLHVGMRAPYIRKHKDHENYVHYCGFDTIHAREIDQIGVSGVADKIKERIGSSKVYVSVDIDVLDPAYAPGTGTAEAGGYSTREFLTLLDSLEGLNIVGADVVEVSPPYDTNAGITALAASEIVNSLFFLIESHY